MRSSYFIRSAASRFEPSWISNWPVSGSASRSDIQLRLDDVARDRIGEAGFDTVYGARPLKRAIQQQIENPLAQQILRGDFVAGDRVVAKLKRDGLVFEKERLH